MYLKKSSFCDIRLYLYSYESTVLSGYFASLFNSKTNSWLLKLRDQQLVQFL